MPKKHDTSFYINKFKEIHNDKYDYSKSEITTYHKEILIICPEHGEFYQRASVHLKGHGCPKCSLKSRSKKRTLNTNDFIEKSNIIHNNKYDYSKTIYKKAVEKVIITCNEHGDFLQSPNSHLGGHGCPECSNVKKPSTDEFVEKAIKIHGNKYDYSKVDYINARTKVKIICSKHGPWNTTPDNHLRGGGCPSCRNSKGELKVKSYLESKHISYIEEYTFDECKNKELLRFDFYLPKSNTCIEYDGMQHYKPWVFNDEKKAINKLKKQKIKDSIKTKYCKDNNIKLIRIPYTEFKNIENILKKEIKKD